jgi:YesN/AraC family two-component response regulator
MISEYEFHRVMSDNNDHKCGYVVHFRKTFIDKFLKFFNIEHLLNKIFDRTCKVINLNLRQIEQIEQLFAALLKAYERYALNPQDSILHTALVAALFNLLAAITRMMPADSLPPVMTRTEEIIRRIIVYIDEHYADVLKLEDLALRFCLNKYYLSHIFRTYTGFTLFEYILRKRIVEAQKLLKDTDLSIDVIYPQCGFTNKQYFYKVFKKIVNSSPTAFKKTGHTKRSRQAG